MAILKNYDEPIEYSFAVPDLGATWFSNAFLVQLAETEEGAGGGAGVGEVLGRCGFESKNAGGEARADFGAARRFVGFSTGVCGIL